MSIFQRLKKYKVPVSAELFSMSFTLGNFRPDSDVDIMTLLSTSVLTIYSQPYSQHAIILLDGNKSWVSEKLNFSKYLIGYRIREKCHAAFRSN